MAIKTYYTTQNNSDWVRRLDDVTLPWINIDSTSGSTGTSIVSSPTDLNHAVRTGANNTIQVTTDGGATWFTPGGNAIGLQPNPAESWGRSQFVDDSNIFVMANNGSVAFSTDGGATFNMCVTQPTDTGLIDPAPGLQYRVNFHFITPLIGIATYQGKVRKTINGGVTWTDLNGGVALELNSFKIGQVFISQDQQTILAMSGYQVHQSIDGGLSFNVTYTHPVYTVAGLYDMTWINNSEIWIMGQENTLVKSSDGGATWNDVRVYTPNADGFFCGHFLDANRAFFGLSPFIGVGNPGYVASSTDGGVNIVNSDQLPAPTNPQAAFYPIGIWSTEIECEGFDIVPDPIVIPDTPINETTTFDVTINNTGVANENYTASLLGCSPELTIVSPNPIAINAGGSGVFTLQYAPVSVESGTCQLQVANSCLLQTVDVQFESLNIPACPHFNICITGPACAPDCIAPGDVIRFDLGGTISLVAYPTVVTFNVVNQGTQEVVYTNNYPVANDAELDAIQINVVAPGPGHYCAEVCIPGCNTIRTLCFDVCQPFDIYKDSCFHWHVHRPTECAECETDSYLVEIRELEGDVIVPDVLWDITQDNTFEFEVQSDGIYIFDMKHPETGEVLYSFAAFETCQLQECFKIMMDKIMCSCVDPCCTRCTGTQKEHMDFARGALNKLVPLYLTYLGMARRNELYTVGMKWITDDQMCFLHDANATLAKILEIIEDCGCLCPEQKNTASNRGDCKSC